MSGTLLSILLKHLKSLNPGNSLIKTLRYREAVLLKKSHAGILDPESGLLNSEQHQPRLQLKSDRPRVLHEVSKYYVSTY